MAEDPHLCCCRETPLQLAENVTNSTNQLLALLVVAGVFFCFFFLFKSISTFTCTDYVKYFSKLIFCTNIADFVRFLYLKVGRRVLDLCIYILFFFACGYQIYTLVVFEYKAILTLFLRNCLKTTKQNKQQKESKRKTPLWSRAMNVEVPGWGSSWEKNFSMFRGQKRSFCATSMSSLQKNAKQNKKKGENNNKKKRNQTEVLCALVSLPDGSGLNSGVGVGAAFGGGKVGSGFN